MPKSSRLASSEPASSAVIVVGTAGRTATELIAPVVRFTASTPLLPASAM
jgi:hypothetical protein